jgi:hypothetical protein
MRPFTANALVSGGCALSLIGGYALEQFSSEPIDVTPRAAALDAGTAVVQSLAEYDARPPNGPIEPTAGSAGSCRGRVLRFGSVRPGWTPCGSTADLQGFLRPA